jgi:Flp pilus assembly protein TadB
MIAMCGMTVSGPVVRISDHLAADRAEQSNRSPSRHRIALSMTGEQRARSAGPGARKHYKRVIIVRALLAPWILFVTVFLCVKGYWYGLVFLPLLALDLWLLRSLVRYERARKAGD